MKHCQVSFTLSRSAQKASFKRMCTSAGRCSAFSLIELLVTIAVIAILALISFGLVGKARDVSALGLNASNLRALGIASLSYASAHGGNLPATTQSIDGVEVPRQTNGNHVNSSASPLKLLGRDYPGGAGDENYIESADVFYGPFTPLLDRRRRKGRFYSTKGADDEVGPFKIGYIFFSLPSAADGSTPARSPLLYSIANDRISGEMNSRSPLYCDIWNRGTLVEETGFYSSRFMVVHLDGSVSSFDSQEINSVGSINGMIYRMTGDRL